jgi:RNA polymerase sigma-70 factor, ECF subfamily
MSASSPPDETPRPQDGPGDRGRRGESLPDGPGAGRDPFLRAPPRPVTGKVNTARAGTSNKEARRKEAQEDLELVQLAQKGDKAAFRALVERHERPALALAFGLLRDRDDAREVVQEAFLRVHRALDTFKADCTFYTWFYRIVTNAAIDRMRKIGPAGQEYDEQRSLDGAAAFALLGQHDGDDPLLAVHRREIVERIQAALDDLPPYHRGVIVMRELQGMSYDEMTEATGVSRGTIMSRLFHARRKLQRALADYYAEERPDGARRQSEAEDAS